MPFWIENRELFVELKKVDVMPAKVSNTDHSITI